MKIRSRPVSFDNKLSAIISLVIGAGIMGGGLWARQINAYEREHWGQAQGVVIDTLTYRPNKSLDETYAPVIEFEANGDRAQYEGPYKSYRWSEGKEVTIRYDPQRPNDAARIIQPFDELAPVAAMILGVVVAGIGLKQVIPIQISSKDPSS